MPKQCNVVFTWNGDQLSWTVRDTGNVTMAELNWALDQLKQRVLSGRPASGQSIPGMLTPELTRVAPDVARRLVRN